MKILKISLLPIITIFLFYSCKKVNEPENIKANPIENYKAKTIAGLTSSVVFARGGSSQFPQIIASDFNKTVNFVQYDAQNRQEAAYVTDIERNGAHIGTIIGYKTKNNQFLNIVSVPYNVSTNRKGVDIYYIDGTKVGYYEIENNIVVETGVIGTTSISDVAAGSEVARSWWGCTRHCISDAHIACYGDSHCMTMLVISNVPNGNGQSGLGSASIAIACGVACAGNTNLELP